MNNQQRNGQKWQQFFEKRSNRALPVLQADIDYSTLPASLARSLAIFQLGESGGGAIVEQVRSSKLQGTDDDYTDAVDLFVREEHRHGNVLAMCVRLLDGKLIRKNWTANLFVYARRLMGLRFKVLVLLAAEVVGICYYHLLASKLPTCNIRDWLTQIVEDEQAHLHFHCNFLHGQVQSNGQRRLFIALWRCLMVAAAVAVIIDHRYAIRDMGLDLKTVWQRWMAYSLLAEQLVTGTASHRGSMQPNPALYA